MTSLRASVVRASTWAAAFCAMLSDHAAAAPPAPRPNVVFVLFDDMGFRTSLPDTLRADREDY